MKAKAKGSRIEREIKKMFQDAGFEVVRSAGSFSNTDLFVRKQNKTFSIQVKARKKHSVYSLFEGADSVVIKADKKEPVICLSLSKFLQILEE